MSARYAALACLALALLAAPVSAFEDPAARLRAEQSALLERFGGDPRAIPLAEKAAFFERAIARYHWTPWNQIAPRVTLPRTPDGTLRYEYGADVSTWNGAYLSALAYRYRATRSQETLDRIAALLEGLDWFQRVTGVPGLAARVVLPGERPLYKADRRYRRADGRAFVYRGDPAKGTYIQLVGGYADALVWAGEDLSDPARRRAVEALNALVLHVVRNGFRIRGADGKPTPYGDLRPRLLWFGRPFNAQAALMLASAAHTFPPDDTAAAETIRDAYASLIRRRPYWGRCWLPPFYAPQRVGRSRFIKANDVNHLSTASFVTLTLELHRAARLGSEPDRRLLRHVGATLHGVASRLPRYRNSVANLRWLALHRDPAFSPWKEVDASRDTRALERLLDEAIEQLRRFGVDRFRHEGDERRTRGPRWVDAYRPDAYYWKVPPGRVWETTGPPTALLTAAIDYLHAYWMLRAFGLDRDPHALSRHGEVL